MCCIQAAGQPGVEGSFVEAGRVGCGPGAGSRQSRGLEEGAGDRYIHTYIDLYRSYISYFFQVLHIMIFCLYVCVYVFLYFCIYVCRSQWSIVDIGDEPIESCLS